MNKIKKIALAALAGGVVFGGGCIPWRTVVVEALIGTGLEWATDNDAVFDLFEDGNVTAEE